MSSVNNKGGRPRTGRDKPITIKLSDEAKALLDQKPNKTAFINALVRGDVAQVKCPHCGKVIELEVTTH